MSKSEITCPHKLPITKCPEHWAIFQAMTNQHKDVDSSHEHVWNDAHGKSFCMCGREQTQ